MSFICCSATQMTLTGSCGALMNSNNSGWEGVLGNYSAAAPNNAIGTINFDKGTYKFLETQAIPYGNKTHVDEKLVSESGTLIFESFDSESGIYHYTSNSSLDSKITNHMYFLPVNSGNTFFITAFSSSPSSSSSPIASGVCQKI